MRTIAKHTRLAGIAVVVIAAACSEPIAPTGSTTIATENHLPSPDGEGPRIAPLRVTVLSGLDADTALRAQAQRQLRGGDTRLAQFIDTATGWSASRLRSTRALAAGSPLPGLATDISGDGEPGDFNLGMLQQPVIYYHNTFVAINSHTATATTTQYFANATDAKSDMTYKVAGPNGMEVPETTSPFSGVGGVLYECVDDIVHRRPNPNCNVQGSVYGYVGINLSVGCSETIFAHAIHNAWAVVPVPDFTRTDKGWTAKLALVHGGDANPGFDAEVSASNAPCDPPHVETRRVSGGDIGGMQIIMEERQVFTTCYAIQDRTVQGDGYVGPWVTVGMECYSSVASKSGADTSRATRYGVPFTLVGLTGDDATPQIIRRGSAHAASEQDAIAINLETATASDIAAAVVQLRSIIKRDRTAGDAVYPLRRTAIGALDTTLRSAYENLLANLRTGREETVPGVGNARTVPVIVIQ